MPRSQRDASLAAACAGDEALREDVLSLLQAHDAAGEYFDDLSAQVLTPVLSAIAEATDPVRGTEGLDVIQARLGDAYRIEREITAAGMSRIFVAEEQGLKRRVVIKVLPPEMAAAVNVERFRREIGLAARLQHPHIVPLLTSGSADGTLYYTMPFVTGQTLRERLARDGPLPVELAMRIWRDVLDALAYAHANGVIHRDIKPGNILLSGRHALVSDFGIARALESASDDAWETTAGLAIGTPVYMAPEQAAGAHDIDQRVDIYATGLLMYEMLGGSAPFVAGSPREILQAHVTREPQALLRADAPAALVQLVMRCLAKDPASRPQSAELLLAELDDVAPKHTAPAGQRRRVAIFAAVVLLIAVTLFTARWWRASVGSGSNASVAVARTPDIAAYEWYRRGADVALMRGESGQRQAIEYFQRAIAIDSGYAAAHAGLARMYISLWNGAPAAERSALLTHARQSALKAVALDGEDADAVAALGWYRMASREFQSAEAAFIRAIELDSMVIRGYEGLARVYMMYGMRAEQLAASSIGIRRDPMSHSAIREHSLALATNGRCAETLEQLRTLKTLTPIAKVAGVLRGQCYASLQMWPEAIAEFEWADEQGTASGFAFLGHALARAGRHDEAARVLAELLSGRKESHGSFGIAIVYAGMRDYDATFTWLEKAVDDNTVHVYIMHPMFDDVRRDPRFERIRVRLGIA